MKVNLDKIIRQGNQKEMQQLFDDISKKMWDTFNEDNFFSISSFILELLVNSWKKDLVAISLKNDGFFDDFILHMKEILGRDIEELGEEVREKEREKDPLYMAAKQADIAAGIAPNKK